MDEIKLMSAWLSTLIQNLLCFRTQVKVFHWQTSQFSQHKALDKLTRDLDKFGDKVVEISLGIYDGKFDVPSDCVDLVNIPETGGLDIPKNYLEKVVRPYFKSLEGVTDIPSSVRTVLDDIQGSVDRTIYLLHLK